ncbi:Actin-like protein arp9 (SWI/SNF complex component arp9) [Neopestalotiopsis sp. 37M]|nr:Actin-like protein arp9 (SWI/SNF complex component arp9) [Neopestalotiopsis sp. 37M]
MAWPKGTPRPFGRYTRKDGTRQEPTSPAVQQESQENEQDSHLAMSIDFHAPATTTTGLGGGGSSSHTQADRAGSTTRLVNQHQREPPITPRQESTSSQQQSARLSREVRNLQNPWFLGGPNSTSADYTESDDDDEDSEEEDSSSPLHSFKGQKRPLPSLPDSPARDTHSPRQLRAVRREELRSSTFFNHHRLSAFHQQLNDNNSSNEPFEGYLDLINCDLSQLDLSHINLSDLEIDFDDLEPSEFGEEEEKLIMSSQQGKWREEQVLIICPGSHTTMAQLGCAELTPPANRIPTRMFKDPDTGEYHPHYTYKRKKATAVANGGDDNKTLDEDDYEFVEDRDSVEGAIYPIVGGRIVNMDCFLAFLDYVHALLTTTYHNTPIVLMASPQWTRPDAETIARYIFEKTRTPALCLLHSAVAAQYGIKWPTMTVVDIGFEKVDVTCLYDNMIVSSKTLGFPNPHREISGGEVFTQKLQALLKDSSFTHDMAEQLKKSPLCEVLPYAGDFDELMELPTETSAPTQPLPAVDTLKINEPPKPAPQIGGEDEEGAEGDKAGDEGVLDVANIVTSGNTREFLAKKEKEKEKEKALRGKKGKGQEPEPAKAARLPNSKRKFATFHFEEFVHEDVDTSAANGASKSTSENPANGEATTADGAPSGEETKEVPPISDATAELPFAAEAPNLPVTERRTRRVRKDFEVGLERFLFADRDEIDRITTTIYRTIQNIDDIYQRSGCWDNLVFVGNGSRLRGLKENILQTLHARHLISPSSATIFTSELPSNMATPTGTGSQTPTGSFTGQLPPGQLALPGSSSVNPLLQAATTASMGVPGSVQAPGSTAGDAGPSRHSHAQTPTSIKLATLPTYLAEWTKNGFEEAMFLGSLIAARLAYCIHNLDVQTQEAQRGMSLNRVDYNELGPKAINGHSMLG